MTEQPPLWDDDASAPAHVRPARPATIAPQRYTLPQPPAARAFDGETYDPAEDHARLNRQQLAVYGAMQDGQWRTLRQLADTVGASEASVSARLRDLRKARYGGHTVERKRLEGGLYAYRLVTA